MSEFAFAVCAPGMERALKARRHRPMFMVDLAVPRDIEPEVAKLADVYLDSFPMCGSTSLIEPLMIVVVGAIGKDLRMDYTALGDTTNLAARLLNTLEKASEVLSSVIIRRWSAGRSANGTSSKGRR